MRIGQFISFYCTIFNMTWKNLIKLVSIVNWHIPNFKGKHLLILFLLNLIPNSLGRLKSIHNFYYNVDKFEAKNQLVFSCETFH
jgi:hypothetical protein